MILAERDRVSGPFRIIDLGGRADYWRRVGFDFLEQHDLYVVCINHSQAELYADGQQHPRITAQVGDACNMVGAADESYQMVHSNSVVEHVGRFSNMRAFANEVRRLAPAYYVQTPYFWFPIDPHWPRMPFFSLDADFVATKVAAPVQPGLGWTLPRYRPCHGRP